MSHITLTGRCLCGAVHYEASGDPLKFYHCHCERCRKSTGTGHATNLMLANAQLVFTQGESHLKRYKVPEAERFTRQFCDQCGSPVARLMPESEAVIIPAGSLDSEIPIKPQAHIFWDSRATWSCDSTALPHFSEYPD